VKRLTKNKQRVLLDLLEVAPEGLIAPVLGDSAGIAPGSLYPALYDLVAVGLLESQWIEAESGRAAKEYTVTPNGVLLAKEIKAGRIAGTGWRKYLPAPASLGEMGLARLI